MNTVTIEGKKYTYLFGMAVLKKFAAHKKIKSVNSSLEVITTMNFNDPSPENMDDLASLFLFAIQRGASKENKTVNLNVDDMIDWIYSGTSQLQEMINVFSESIGGETEEKVTKGEKKKAA